MNIKNFWMMLAIAIVSICTISCGGDDDDDEGMPDNGSSTEVKTDYIATTKLKTVKINALYYESLGNYMSAITLYEDFHRKYGIALITGQIALIPFERNAGSWQLVGLTGYNLCYSSNYSYYIDCGKCNSIADVTEKVKLPSHGSTEKFLSAEPNHGYSAVFQTEDNETKNLRMYISNYTLNDSGALSSITVQYQIY